MSAPAVGDPAPEIALPDEHGTIHRLADRRGQWTVIYFYPEDDTTNCTIEACQFRDAHEEIRGQDAEVWGISPDPADSHSRFRAKYGLPFTLLSDVTRAVIERYGAWGLKQSYGREYMGVVRTSYLVDPDLRVARVWNKVKADGHAAQVSAALAELQAAQQV